MSIDGTIGGSYTINDRQAAGLAGTVNVPVVQAPSISFTNGSGAGQATQEYPGLRTLPGASENVDLTSLADTHGTAIDFTTVKGLLIKNLSTSHNLVVGAAGSNPWATFLNATGTITLPPGAWILAATPDAAGWAVTASTACILKVAGTAGEQYQLALVG